jgi:hypothetical protein
MHIDVISACLRDIVFPSAESPGTGRAVQYHVSCISEILARWYNCYSYILGDCQHLGLEEPFAQLGTACRITPPVLPNLFILTHLLLSELLLSSPYFAFLHQR